MPDHPRPVWLTREQRDWLEQVFAPGYKRYADPMVAAWDAAPANPTAAVVSALIWSPAVNPRRVTVLAPFVLRSLGMPDA